MDMWMKHQDVDMLLCMGRAICTFSKASGVLGHIKPLFTAIVPVPEGTVTE